MSKGRPRLALDTFGVFREPAEHPANAGFHERNDPILQQIEHMPGFLGRSGYEDEPGPESWGAQFFPRFYVERGDGWSPSTLSLWRDAESAMAFSYRGLHAEAMRHAREWFDKPQWPPYAVWWVTADHVPDWAEAVARYEYLADHGPTPHAFDFKRAFDAEGAPATIDHARVRALATAGAGRESSASP